MIASSPEITARLARFTEPVLASDYATRKATASYTSGHHVPEQLATVVVAVVTTDTHEVNDACVAIELEIRHGDRPARSISFDVVASEIDVVVAALTRAVSVARENGVLEAPLAICAAALGAGS